MATRTHRLATFHDGAAYVEYDYDDVTGEVLTVRGVNDGPSDMAASINGSDASGNQAKNVNYSYTFAAGSGLTEWALTPGQRKRFDLEPDGRGPDAEGEPDYYPTLRGLVFEAGI